MASSDPPVALPLLYECAPIPASSPSFIIKYGSRIGFLSKNYRHIWGDWDYGLRNTKLNGLNILAPKIIGECQTPNNKMYINKSGDKFLSINELWKRYLHFGQQDPKERFRFYKQHGGLFWLFFYFGTYLKFWIINILKRENNEIKK